MKEIKKILNPAHLGFSLNLNDFPPHALFFDIETTGFSPARSHIYLIGSAYLTDDETPRLIVEQFFAESPANEPELLLAFSNLAAPFETFISFNGLKFDLPFLNERARMLSVPFACGGKNCIDLYRIFSSCRHIFHLENYKQKTLERFLGIEREDKYDGGELIAVYKKYAAGPKQEKELLPLLLGHNYEDVLGMTRLLPLLAFERLFAGALEPVSCGVLPYRRLDGTCGQELLLLTQPHTPLPASFSCNNGQFFAHSSPEGLLFRVPFYEGTLKYFYPDYRDYYYLPDEDMAIHKSVAAYVDKAHRVKAKASTCYSKKSGLFLPQQETLFTPAFYEEYKAPLSWFAWQEAFEKDTVMQKRYCMHMLAVLRAGT